MKLGILVLIFASVCDSTRYIVQKSWGGYTCPAGSLPSANILFAENSCLESPDLSEDVKVYCKGDKAAGKVCTKGKRCQTCEDDNEVTLPSTCLYDSDTGSSSIFSCVDRQPVIPSDIMVTKHATANSSCTKQQVWTYGSSNKCVGVPIGNITKYYSSSCNQTHQLIHVCSDTGCLNCNTTGSTLLLNHCFPPGSPKQKPYEDQSYSCGRFDDSSASSLFSHDIKFFILFSIFFLLFPSLKQLSTQNKS